MTTATITVLGCGNSTGVPAIGNAWGQCDPNEPRNTRTRCSIAVQTDQTTLIIDTGPDFRGQVNAANITHIDAVLYTHAHSDHVNGIDELRLIRFRNKELVKVYVNKQAYDDIRHRFEYMFEGSDTGHPYPPMLDPYIFKNTDFGQKLRYNDIGFTPFLQEHGEIKATGYRFGDFGYSVDMKDLDADAIQSLKGIKTWLVDAAGYHSTDNKVHANLETIYALNEQIGAETVYLTSLSLAMDYKTLQSELKQGYYPAYDGLKLQCAL